MAKARALAAEAAGRAPNIRRVGLGIEQPLYERHHESGGVLGAEGLGHAHRYLGQLDLRGHVEGRVDGDELVA